MYCREITYDDFDGNELTEKFYFNLNEAEIIKWITTNGDYSLDAVLNKMIEKKRGKDIIDAFENLIYMSYGERDVDSRRFIKTKEVKDAFMQSNAYSVLFMELITDAGKAAEFLNGIVPAKMAAEVSKILKENPDGIPDSMKDYIGMIPNNTASSAGK